ncbi:MAG: right-handed parallel beta-helix repeat-containing protein, partial [Pseudomonadota bacterium]
MTRHITATAAAALLMVSIAQAGPVSTLCVDPGDDACFDTIQGAVDAASAGDQIVIRPRPDGFAYEESVVVATSDLVISGSMPGSFSIDEFDDLLSIDWSMEQQNCPSVQIDVCDTRETPGLCGFDADEGLGIAVRSAFNVSAPRVTIEHLTIRHGFGAILVNEGADGANLRDNCVVRSHVGFVAGTDEPLTLVENVTVTRNRMFSVTTSERNPEQFAVQIHGNGAVVSQNLLNQADGIKVADGETGGSSVSLNAVLLSEDVNGIEVRNGANHRIENNYIRLTEGDAISLFQTSTSEVVGNRIVDIPDDEGGIRSRESSDLLMADNVIVGSSDSAVVQELGAARVENNEIRSVGGDLGDFCVRTSGAGVV